tara:strand:- start:606 stop:857 length:252 start_codon:yes stop_codon:yes gene_type:complete
MSLTTGQAIFKSKQQTKEKDYKHPLQSTIPKKLRSNKMAKPKKKFTKYQISSAEVILAFFLYGLILFVYSYSLCVAVSRLIFF